MREEKKIIIYQLFPRLFGNRNHRNIPYGTLAENGSGKFSDISNKALRELRKMGCTHVWYTGVLEHSTVEGFPDLNISSDPPEIVKGRAGSPYAIRDYFDVCAYLADHPQNRLGEFEDLIIRTHEEGLKVLIDFVPNHVARCYESDCKPPGIRDLGTNDNTCVAFSPANDFYYLPGQSLQLPEICYETARKQSRTEPIGYYRENPAKVSGNDVFSANPSETDWYETVKLNYGIDFLDNHSRHFIPVPPLWQKMLYILRYWRSKGVDGFRCDMAEMVPVEFWEWAIRHIKDEFPDTLFIAEIYQPSLYQQFTFQGGFDFLYDKAGFYDTVRKIYNHEHSTRGLTICWQNLQGLEGRMLRFMENHDEQRLASQHFLGNPFHAIPAMVAAATMQKGPLLLYNGQETGETGDQNEGFSGPDGRTTIYDFWGMTRHQQWMNDGAFDGGRLDEDGNALRQWYVNLLQVCQESPAIVNGGFYDLMWFNEHVYEHSAGKIFAYLRHHRDQVLLFVLNFSTTSDFEIYLKIPGHATEAAQMQEAMAYRAVEMNGAADTISFNPDEAETNGIFIHILSYSALIFELQKQLH